MVKYLLMSLLIVFTAITSAFSGFETLRCGSKLISIGDHKVEVRSKCGEPHTEDTVALKRTLFTRDRGRRLGLPVSQTEFVDEWTYDTDKTYKIRKTKRIIRLLFEANRLVEIETLNKF